KKFEKNSEKFLITFEKKGKEITSLFSKKIKASNEESKHIARAYYFIIERETKDYHLYKKKLDFEKKINEKKYEIEKAYFELHELYTILKDSMQDCSDEISKVEFNTLRLSLLQINKEFEKINNIIITELNSEVNNYIIADNSVKELLSSIVSMLSIQTHIILSGGTFKYGVSDYSKLKKLEPKNLQTGDVILYDEYEAYKRGLITKQIKYFIKSTIMHAAMYYGTEDGRYLSYEASGRNRKVSYIGDLTLDNGTRHLILRSKKRLSIDDKKLVKKLLEENINRKFSVVKMYGIALNYTLTRLYKTWFPFLTTGKNIYFGKGIFCSQAIAEIYQSLGINISNNEDYGMVSPIDIFNSFELEIVGYIEDPSIKK
ncbi:MAG: hypothetical protein VXZ40_03600, partial [Nanoarchaeota archaeon]|nr:hypothetical protein [Nanoarchaeota archaeon]